MRRMLPVAGQTSEQVPDRITPHVPVDFSNRLWSIICEQMEGLNITGSDVLNRTCSRVNLASGA
jgi:hypothetical protein